MALLRNSLAAAAAAAIVSGVLTAAPAAASADTAHARSLGPQLTSSNWVGYVTNGGTYTSVEASWVQPTMNCGSGDGDAVFWIGLDGWGSSTVEQDGTRGQCIIGRAVYSAWWETYPTNPITSFSDTVRPGDQFYSKIAYQGNGVYDMVLQNKTEGWTEHITPSGAAGASNSSAEVVAEAPSAGSREPLADFGTVHFSGSMANGSTFGNANAQKVDMVQNGTVDATPTELTGGTDFAIDWQHL
ncbi:MAG: hypothetical protein JOZ47_02925 [Kutzneria sp.]|nr:hypothetical protein [Kutzneria sp.]MBV9844016.1 hypothetical protein [Kutzneria sp.]